MRRRLGREIFPYDPEIERTLWRARRCRIIFKNQLEGEIDELKQNMGSATWQGENNSQVLNPL